MLYGDDDIRNFVTDKKRSIIAAAGVTTTEKAAEILILLLALRIPRFKVNYNY